MKKQNAITIIASALLVAGCAHHEQQTAAYDTMSAPGYRSMGSYRNGSTYNYSSTTQTPTTGLEATAPSTSSAGKNPSDARTITSGTAKSDQPVGDADQALIVVVQKAITDEPAVSAVMPNVNVAAQSGAVTLTGTVANEQQKQQIESVVKNATGVTSVDNQLQVAYKPTSEGESSRIYSNATSQAEGAATSPQGTSTEQSKNQDALDSSKSSTTSTSQSEGTATSPQGTSGEQSKSQDSLDSSKSSATPTAQTEPQQKGAASTQSDTSTSQGLTPTGRTGDTVSANVQGTTAADQSVAQKVIEQLRADSTLAATLPLVQITIADGKATIKGAVKSDDQKQQIEKSVQQVSGVNSVDNQLKVSTTTNDSTNP